MPINVEIIGGSMMVQHYVEALGRNRHLILGSTSDVFNSTERTSIHATWELSVRKMGGSKREFANRAGSYATDEFLMFLARQGIPFDQIRAQRQPASIAHNQSETASSAASTEEAAGQGDFSTIQPLQLRRIHDQSHIRHGYHFW